MDRKSILNGDINILLQKYRLSLIKEGIPVEKMILFGSYAKGTAKYYSDLDVCVVSKTFGRDSFTEMVRLKQMAGKIEPMIEPHPLHPRDLNDRWNPLSAQIRVYGKIIN